jgi:hypothetical protein
LKVERVGSKGKMKMLAMSYFVSLFKKLKLDTDLGVDTEGILCPALFTAKGEYKSQGPHTDYDYQPLVKDAPGNKNRYFAWTALVPITEAESWIYIWFGIR